MKRKLLISAAVIAVIFLIVIIGFGVQPVSARHVQCGDVVLKDDRIPLSTEDARSIGKLFHGKISSRDNPSCGFSKEFQIILTCDDELQTFYIGQDGCGIIYWHNENIYFSLSEKEVTWLRELLISKYDCDGWFYSR